MGKASRKKKQAKHDPAKAYAEGLCTRGCGRPPKTDCLWCSKCIANGRRLRASRPPRRVPREETLAMLDALEADLNG